MHPILTFLRNHILPYWKSIIVIVVPLALLPLPVIAQTKVKNIFKIVFLGLKKEIVHRKRYAATQF